MSKDDIAEALNHIDGEHGTTDIYIEKDWGIVDDVQAAVINFLRDLNKPPVKQVKVSAIAELVKPEEQRLTMRLVVA